MERTPTRESSPPHSQLFVSPRGDFFAFLLPKRSGFTLIHTGSQQKRVYTRTLFRSCDCSPGSLGFLCRHCLRWSSIRHHHAITSLDFHPTEPCVGYGDEKGKIRINYCLFASNTRDGKKDNSKHHNQKTSQPQNNRIDKFEWHTTPVSALHFSPDGYHLFSGGLEVRAFYFHNPMVLRMQLKLLSTFAAPPRQNRKYWSFGT